MAIDLQGRSLVITGGGTGIGAATAIAAADAGLSVCICGRRPEPLETIVEKIRGAGGQAIAVTNDVTAPGSEIELLDAAEQAFGPTWAVFANAGRGLDRTGHETTDNEMKEIFEVNFFATHRLMAEAASRMVAHGQGGHLLACASCLSRFAIPRHAAYSATKASQDILCQAMRLELKPMGIHVSSVHPITTTTEFFDVTATVSGREESRALEETPRFFLQSSEQVAEAIIRCLRRPRPEVWTSRIVRLVTVARSLFPRLLDRRLRDIDR
ncbi:MAG: SDR family NAD(P)-dependent oxidoreductase [Phycisphaerales bacterium]|nr:SDR family NAD(P)-dependent oxidoreductase [Phycisphaerales bacterium]